MNKLYKILFIVFLLCTNCMIALSSDYDNLYEKLKPFGTTLYNDIDPFEDEDSIKYAYNPYPLFRTSMYLYFQNMTIEPGYYSLTPRKLKNNFYLLFKQGGKVKFIIPVAKKAKTPVNFYKANIPERKKTKWQKFTAKVRKTFYTMSVKSQKVPPPNSFVKVETDASFVILTVYYGDDSYTSLFKKSKF